MSEKCLCPDFELRGKTYEIWHDSSGHYLVDPQKNEVVDTDAIRPKLSNDELLSIYEYGRDW